MNSAKSDSDIQMRRLQPYKCTNADRKLRKKLKIERGQICENCQAKPSSEKLAVHHILETRSFPEFAREPLNMIILCPKCHSDITGAERFGTSMICHFYSSLPVKIRERHVAFLERTVVSSPAIIGAFRDGNSDFWNNKAVKDWTR
jgi:HNH endonuclease